MTLEIVRTAHDPTSFRRVFALVAVRKHPLKGKCTVAARAISQGDLIVKISGHSVVTVPDQFSVQMGAHAHLDQIGPLTYLNHSCAPNVVFNTTELTLTAIRDIAAGEHLSFFYPSTEWRMDTPFDCHCGSAACIGRIDGAASLSDDVLSRYFINAHIHELRRVS